MSDDQENEEPTQGELVSNFILAVRNHLAVEYLMERTPRDLFREIKAVYGRRSGHILLASAQSGRVKAFCFKIAASLKPIPKWSEW